MDLGDLDAPEAAAANAAWDEFLRVELGDLQLGLRDELVLLRGELGEDEYVVALADCRSSGHRGLGVLTTRRLVFVTSERSPSPTVMKSVPLGAVEVVEADDAAMRIASAGAHGDGDEHGAYAFSHTLQAIVRTDGTRALAELVLTLVPADEVREMQEVDDRPTPDDDDEQGEDAPVDGFPPEPRGGPAVVEEGAASASSAGQRHDDELPAPAVAEMAPMGIDLLETRLGERLAAVEQLARDRKEEDTIAADAIRASLAAAVAQLENIEQRLTAAVSELTARFEESVGSNEQRTSALASDLQAALQEVGGQVVKVTDLARKSAAERDQHQEAIGAAVREGAAQSEARLDSLQSAVAAMAEGTEQAVRAMVLEAMNDVGARIEAVQSELQASVGEPITRVNGDLAQLAEHLDRLLLVSAERDPPAVQRDAIDHDLLVTSVDDAIARELAPLRDALTAHLGRTADSLVEERPRSETSGDRAGAGEVAEDAPLQATASVVDDWLNAVLRPGRRPQVESQSAPQREEGPAPQDGAP